MRHMTDAILQDFESESFQFVLNQFQMIGLLKLLLLDFLFQNKN